jgi:dTDP-4-amino-4,6-dideoxygalactose transaminase
MIKPILLSTPHMGDGELEFVKEAFDTNWIAPVGPHIDAFEQEFCQATGALYGAAVSSGTAALHLALRLVGVESGDEVFCSTLTFIATANPITYLGAKPVFIDSDLTTWNMNPELLWEALERRSKRGTLPKAVVLVHLYGQSADIDPILEICDRYEIPLIEDAAESLGATYKGRSTGTFGRIGIYSFNGNKIITTSGGGMLVSDDEQLVNKTRFLATQARDSAPHYQHSETGYNYRLSNILAGIGRGQLRVLNDRIAARRRNYEIYAAALSKLPGIEFMPEADFGRATRWLTCLTIDPEAFGADREQVRLALAKQQIETRPVWKPLHLQPVFAKCKCIDGAISEHLFTRGLCLPSGSNLTIEDLERVIHAIESIHNCNSLIPRSQVELGNAIPEAQPRQFLLNVGGGASTKAFPG